MSEVTSPRARATNSFHVWVSVLIAVVTVATAIFTWRASDAAQGAGAADSAANSALKRKQVAASQVDRDVGRHYEAFLRWSRNSRLATLTNADQLNLLLSADKAALDQLDQRVREYNNLSQADHEFLQQQFLYIDPKNNSYDIKRERAETFADAASQEDFAPSPHRLIADELRQRSRLVTLLITVLACALLLLTVAYGASPAVRMKVALCGAALVAWSLVAAVFLETTLSG